MSRGGFLRLQGNLSPFQDARFLQSRQELSSVGSLRQGLLQHRRQRQCRQRRRLVIQRQHHRVPASQIRPGFAVMQELMDEVRVTSHPGGGTTVRLRRRLSQKAR